ncbi:hypothetical protein BDV37DRAFT_278337 [Aspergillus pseudonomiae]|uniref:Uncharacterized protein n=1 Tax=Aspergillus pseudonomiae TaxID=1506151 RepID=A0A5N7DSM7_9EURO|nr:uncharacterized protein BDV37DRAFT_278337 [Aspergillus pseudonomiae]KAE8409386.1 hypothetical protein BDV37DRAFT_278337 [Aspergillus pseudonomiae]
MSCETQLSIFHDRSNPLATTYELNSNASGKPVPGVLGLTYVRDAMEAPSRKLFNRSAASTLKILRLLTRSPASNTNGPGRLNVDGIQVLYGEDALEERLAPSPGSKADTVINYFSGMRVYHPNGYFTSQFLNCRSSNIKESDISPITSATAHQPIIIHSGVCLFSAKMIGFVPTKGSPVNGDYAIPSLPDASRASLYEIETITRLSSQIADLIAMVTAGARRKQDIQVRLDIPRLQYYAYPLELYERGIVDNAYVQEWMSRVNQRHSQILAIFQQAVVEGLAQRSAPANIQIESTNGTDVLSRYIQTEVASYRSPSVVQAMHVLQCHGPDQAKWRRFFSHIGEDHLPKDLRGLALLSYVYEVLRPGFDAGICHESHARPIILQVDDIAEWRIYDTADKLAKRIDAQARPMLIGMFPFHQVLTSEVNGRSSLFLHDPGHRVYNTVDPASLSPEYVHPVKVVEQTYGKPAGDMMNQLLVLHGLYGGESSAL